MGSGAGIGCGNCGSSGMRAGSTSGHAKGSSSTIRSGFPISVMVATVPAVRPPVKSDLGHTSRRGQLAVGIGPIQRVRGSWHSGAMSTVVMPMADDSGETKMFGKSRCRRYGAPRRRYSTPKKQYSGPKKRYSAPKKR